MLDDSDADPDYIENSTKNDTPSEREGTDRSVASSGNEIFEDTMSNDSTRTHVSESIVSEVQKRKRKKVNSTEKQAEKVRHKMEKHEVGLPCKHNCSKRCLVNFPEELREDINRKYWKIDWKDQRSFILEHVHSTSMKRRRKKSNKPRKQNTYSYSLRSATGLTTRVCKHFFLTTLGFKSNNDKVIVNTMKSHVDHSPAQFSDNRGRHEPKHKVNHQSIKEHIETYHPELPHYRREHAPNKRYLPSDITIVDMHADYVFRNQSDMSYELYRKVVTDEMNISFAKLGNEECDKCEVYHQHKEVCIGESCSTCTAYFFHIGQATIARKEYQKEAAKTKVDGEISVAVDLEKVIMLPRMEEHKVCLFTRRIVAYNETFAAIGSKGQKSCKNIAIIWHEGICGRNDEDIASTYFKFLNANRDAKHFQMWVDNCSAQNKNWTMLTMLCTAVNSEGISAESITLNFFEAGHTFMAADSVHAAVEKQMKKAGKVYDFDDFSKCVANANCIAIRMEPNDFGDWKNGASQYQLKKREIRVLLSDMRQIQFRRGCRTLFYKENYDTEPFSELDFLKKKHVLQSPLNRQEMRGICNLKKLDIINKLVPLMPTNRRNFWYNIPTNNNMA